MNKKQVFSDICSFGAGVLFCGFLTLVLAGCGRQDTEFLSFVQQETQEETVEQITPAMEAEASMQEKTEEPEETEIFVDVCGAVGKPGVYALEPDSRVFEAIEKAGGFLDEAAGEYVNRAQPLTDGQQIYIPTREEAESRGLTGAGSVPGNSGTADSGGADPGSAKVNLNTADVQALQSLSGIGEAKAQAILTYREEHGRFSSIEELMSVPGIKEGTFGKIKDNIVVE